MNSDPTNRSASTEAVDNGRPLRAANHSPEKMLVDVKEAASMLSISVASLWRLVKAEKAPAPIKIGGSTRWRVADLRAYVDNGGVVLSGRPSRPGVLIELAHKPTGGTDA